MLREAHGTEAAELTALALKSKAYWGYDAAFMQACQAELTITSDDIRHHPTFVLEHDGAIAGFFMLEPLDQTSIELGYLYVDPAMIGHGFGKQLFNHAGEVARSLGFQRMMIQADPNAEAFYQAMGATTICYTPSGSIAGRVLPWMEFRLEARGDRRVATKPNHTL